MSILHIVNDADGQCGSATRFYQRAEIHYVKDGEALNLTYDSNSGYTPERTFELFRVLDIDILRNNLVFVHWRLIWLRLWLLLLLLLLLCGHVGMSRDKPLTCEFSFYMTQTNPTLRPRPRPRAFLSPGLIRWKHRDG